MEFVNLYELNDLWNVRCRHSLEQVHSLKKIIFISFIRNEICHGYWESIPQVVFVFNPESSTVIK